jgi:hypothetical protein
MAASGKLSPQYYRVKLNLLKICFSEVVLFYIKFVVIFRLRKKAIYNLTNSRDIPAYPN